MIYVMLLYVIRSLTINAMEINRSVCRHVHTVRHSLPDASDASTRAFTLQSQAAANRSRPLRTPPDVASVYRTNPTQWTQCVHGQKRVKVSVCLRTVFLIGLSMYSFRALNMCARVNLQLLSLWCSHTLLQPFSLLILVLPSISE